MVEKKQAEADKEIEEESGVASASAELKLGERKVVSDGSDGPIVEIIKRTTPETSPETLDGPESEIPEETTEA